MMMESNVGTIIFSTDEDNNFNLIRIETDTLTHAVFVDGSADKIGFGTSAPTSGFVTMDQASSTM